MGMALSKMNRSSPFKSYEILRGLHSVYLTLTLTLIGEFIMRNLKETFLVSLHGKPFDDQVVLWNEFCQYSDNGSQGDLIYADVLDLVEAKGFTGTQTAHRILFGDVTNVYQYAFLDDKENIRSCDTLGESPIDVGYLADWLEESEHQEWLDFVEAMGE